MVQNDAAATGLPLEVPTAQGYVSGLNRVVLSSTQAKLSGAQNQPMNLIFNNGPGLESDNDTGEIPGRTAQANQEQKDRDQRPAGSFHSRERMKESLIVHQKISLAKRTLTSRQHFPFGSSQKT